MVHNITWENFAMLNYDFDDFLAKIIATFSKVNHEKVENTKIENLQQGSHLILIYFMGWTNMNGNWNEKRYINKFHWGLQDEMKG